ncbi:TolC family protein [Sulfurimonas sp. SAG-AH-194-L11]|nr:TolC family protein [Sulfurimonas sp. SAG-AH-194-L11]MDF1877100.1 TolC family protein [Sulfurimonas sp. SAG-AH-194-L11]
MKYLFLIALPLLLMAENLEVLYPKVKTSNIYKSKNEAIKTKFQNKSASLYKDSWQIGAGLGYADVRDGSDNGSEYQLSLGKSFTLNSGGVDDFVRQNSHYASLQTEILENRLSAQLWRLYGNYCITMDALQAKAELASVYDAISKHIQKGVEYGEFDSGKAIMAQLSLENVNLQISKLENILQQYELSIKRVVPFDGQFECKSLEVDLGKLFDPEYSALLPMLQSKKNVDTLSSTITKQSTNSLNLNGLYTREIDTDRYMLNISMPLAIGEKNQARRAAAMSQLEATNYEMAYFQNSYKNETITLKRRLEIYKKYLFTSEEYIKKNADILIEQSNMRFRAGEESFISMLKATQTKLQMIETILGLKIDRHNAVAKYMNDYAVNPKEIIK